MTNSKVEINVVSLFFLTSVAFSCHLTRIANYKCCHMIKRVIS